jgi:hypothetical protein
MPTIKNLGVSTSWNPQVLSRPVQGLLYLYLKLMFPLDRNTWTEDGKSNEGMAKTKVESVQGQGRIKDSLDIEVICMVL